MTTSDSDSTPTTTLSEQVVQDAFHSYLKSSLTQARVEKLLDADILSSAESDLMITGPALCLYFAALRCTTNPPSVPLPRSTKSVLGVSGPMDLSCENCPPAFLPFLRVWAHLVPQIQSLLPEHQHDLARIICGLAPLSVPIKPELKVISAEMRGVALEISQRRTFQDRYASALQAALDYDGPQGARTTSFVPPPSYDTTSSQSGDHLSILRSPSPTLSHRSTASSSKEQIRRTPSPTILAPGISPAIEFIRETLYASLGDTLEQFPAIHGLLHSDPPRAYFASVSLAVLLVSTSAIDFSERSIIGVLGTPLTLENCPPRLQPLMDELIKIGEAAVDLMVDDDKVAMEAVSAGKEIPEETSMERVKQVLIQGVGYERSRVENGGRASLEGRATTFANRIAGLATKMTALPQFRERIDEVFKILDGIGH